MAVELEKIAKLLEEAYENISSLENEKAQLSSEVSRLSSEIELQKEASAANHWDEDDMGSAVEYTAPEHANSESRLDDFLSN